MAGILLIDDAQLMRNLIRTILESKGYKICGEASNGKAGANIYRHLKPDLVFCDIMMDEMDGVECLRMILDEDPDARVVICTSAGDELHNMEALATGAKAFIAKPFNAAEVIRVTEELIGKPLIQHQRSYRQKMEDLAKEKGLSAKQVLDFFEGFRQFCGFRFDDPKVDEKFLRENTASVAIGVRALLSAKMTQAQADQIIAVFQSLLDS